VHFLAQAMPAQRYGQQFCTPPARQTPRPLQVLAVVSRATSHEGGAQTVSAA
jgi:hypothetical protein